MFVSVRLCYDQITGNGEHKILLTETQKKNIDKSKRLKKGLVLNLNYEQMTINHSGGYLQFIIPAVTALATIAKAIIDAKNEKLKKILNGII